MDTPNPGIGADPRGGA